MLFVLIEVGVNRMRHQKQRPQEVKKQLNNYFLEHLQSVLNKPK